MKKIKEFFKKVFKFFSKNNYLLKILLVLIIIIFVLNIFNLNKPNQNLKSLYDKIEKQKEQIDKSKNKSKQLLEELKYKSSESYAFRQKSIKYLNHIKSLKNEANFKLYEEYFLFLNSFSIFNENFAKKNEETFISLKNYHKELLIYDNKLQEYKKEIDKQIFKVSIIPYIMLWKSETWNFGGGIDLKIPITYNFSLVPGLGFYKDPFLKIGIEYKF